MLMSGNYGNTGRKGGEHMQMNPVGLKDALSVGTFGVDVKLNGGACEV